MKQKKNIPQSRKQPFKVPDGYFESMQASVMERIRQENQAENQLSSRAEGQAENQLSSRAEGQAENQLESQKESQKVSQKVSQKGASWQVEHPNMDERVKSQKIRYLPLFSIAAAITGFALISFMIVQSILGTRVDEPTYYDLSLLDETGILYDESVLMESFETTENSDDEYLDWEEDALTYLASSDVAAYEIFETN